MDHVGFEVLTVVVKNMSIFWIQHSIVCRMSTDIASNFIFIFSGLNSLISQKIEFFRKDHMHIIKTDHEPNAVDDLYCNLHTTELIKQSTKLWSLTYSGDCKYHCRFLYAVTMVMIHGSNLSWDTSYPG
jgi:hypothetical protein